MHEIDVQAVPCLLLRTRSHAEVEADLGSEPQQGKQHAADCPVRCGIDKPDLWHQSLHMKWLFGSPTPSLDVQSFDDGST